MFPPPPPCHSTQIIGKWSNFSHFPASIISVISLFIRGGRVGGLQRWGGSREGATNKSEWETERGTWRWERRRAKLRQSRDKNILSVIFSLPTSYFRVKKRGLGGWRREEGGCSLLQQANESTDTDCIRASPFMLPSEILWKELES